MLKHAPLSRRLLAAMLAGTALLGGLAVSAAQPGVASANSRTYCIDGQNAGIIHTSQTSAFAWCQANGGWVQFGLEQECPWGLGSTFKSASGWGDKTLYTAEATCWFGNSPTHDEIDNWDW